jgi:predicted metallopeptidase
MPIKYYPAPEIKQQVDAITSDLDFYHIVPQFVFCIRSKGSKARRTIIHELLHIPGGFSGGFRPHKGYVERKTVEMLYKKLQQTRASKTSNFY